MKQLDLCIIFLFLGVFSTVASQEIAIHDSTFYYYNGEL